MVNSRRKGADWERAVVAWLQGYAWPLARRAATPAEDQDLGDVVGIPGVSLDCKNGKVMTINPWMDQLDGIAGRSDASIAALVIKRPRRTDPARAFVVADLEMFLDFGGEVRRLLDRLATKAEVPRKLLRRGDLEVLWHTKGLSPKKFGANIDLARDTGRDPVVSFEVRGNPRCLVLTDLEYFARLLREFTYA